MKEKNAGALVTVLTTGSEVQLSLAKSLLEEAGIRFHARGEAGLLVSACNRSAAWVEIQVGERDVGRAREALSPLDATGSGDAARAPAGA